MPEGGLADEELLKRLSALYSEAFVAGVAAELVEARRVGVPETEQTLDTIQAADTGETTTARVAEINYRVTDKLLKNTWILFS